MRRLKPRFLQEGDKLRVVLDPSEIASLAHAEKILRDIIAQWVREKRDRGLVTYEPLPNLEE